ncbi:MULTISPECIES: MipA/OmpV family protein [unclassified Moritella]|uniref:MipA/OmpV family protein n=1 Tax=unclassified Moritella TaxID=2637987 RepID=UPI001BACD5BA|nr:MULTISPECIES: MipA/OmpV family protein [unclassified Moritella]QUM84149.1 MipA/OmpV family protein [Moritella sp. 28]QUM88450.1 MipA/OmpV family protein [Moritella sp. 36]
MLLDHQNIICLALISGLCSSISHAASVPVDNLVLEVSERSLDIDTVEAPALDVKKWGLGIGMRRADIPFAVKDDNEDTAVYDILPLMRFENDHGFLHGLEGGIHLWKNADHQVNVYSRFRFHDVPKAFQNSIKGQSFDFGLQYRYIDGPWESDIAVLSDHYQRNYSYTRIKYNWQQGSWSLVPFAELQWKSADFNNHYYGFDKEDAGAGVSMAGGLEGSYHVASNFYLIGQLGLTRLEDDVYDLDSVNKNYQVESFFGFAFYPEYDKPFNPTSTQYKNDEYLRLAYGWATPSNIGDILKFQAERDSENNQMSSVFYGTQIADSLLTMPIDLYFTPGLVWHYSSDVQKDITEVALAIKGFYTFRLGPRWRLGIAEGLSYVFDITYIEGFELTGEDSKRGYENSSKLLNYLDFSFDVNVGDIFGSKALAKTWFGYSIHHRSGIFETSSVFGRIKGGSNYQTVYLQWHF